MSISFFLKIENKTVYYSILSKLNIKSYFDIYTIKKIKKVKLDYFSISLWECWQVPRNKIRV